MKKNSTNNGISHKQERCRPNNHCTNANSDTSIPSWLETPPLSPIKPPVNTRAQELPFEELTWEDFERLCLRLARLEANVEHCQLYGERGQKQEGIDLYARQKLSGKYRAYQCKRVNNFGPAKIKNAVSKFLEGEWSNKTDTFILCTKESLRSTERVDALEKQSALLKEQGITLLSWDSDELSAKLKNLPKLVDDFFGREWVKVFVGEEQAKRLGQRLYAKKIAEFRQRCAVFYKHVFNTHDPGLPMAKLGAVNSLALEERYVLPDIYDQRRLIPSFHTEDDSELEVTEDELRNRPFDNTISKQRIIESRSPSIEYRQRRGVENWLAAESRNIILGGPGSGKSTLFRFIAIDLLKESPRLSLLSQKWGHFLPVWVPFALWTKMISNPATAECSLSELLYNWLKSWNEERLWPLVEMALEDERLLLLVDGLDEWTNEDAARIALDKLKVFVEQRDIPAIVTTRPHGFERLGIQETGWQLGELSDFSNAQQKQLSRIWFTHRVKSQSQESINDEHEVAGKANAETEGFLKELHKSADFQELAKVPLLLCLLIYHKFHNVRLPQSRFKAYASLIEHLISVHPQRRKTAAFLTNASPELTDDDVQKILAHLAYHIQENCSEGLIDHNEAITIVENYLKNCDYGFGLEQREARKYSRQVLEVGENTIGLLVRLSSKEIGFFHRVFQEYLAAYYLSRMPLTEQLSVVENHSTNPQWHEVILGLFHITSRAEDIKEFVSRIKTKLDKDNTVERYTHDTLLCETAFGEFNCPVGLARELAKEAFEQVELGSWMPHRERLLKHILDGLRSTKVKELVKSKLKSWFPCRTRWRERIFNAMANWPRTPEVIECLWKGIHDEETNNSRAAARALADLTTGDSETGNRVASLACNAVDPQTRAAAIEALLRGWPNHQDCERIIEAARQSMSPELRLSAILGKIRLNIQTEEDREELIHLGDWEAGLSYYWNNDVASALINGWLKSPKTKEACFKALRKGTQERQYLERELALRILLEGYPQDEDVARFCVEQIKHEKHPFLLLHLDAWRLLAQNFKNHPEIIEALDGWIPEQEYHQPEVSLAAMVGRTPKAKAKLLSSLASSFPHWPAESLIEGWGMEDTEDTEVAERLTQIAFGSAAEASQIGHLLPQIIKDRAVCRSRILELLQDSECKRPDFIMAGLGVLGNTQGDTGIVNTVLRLLTNQDDFFHREVIASLITNYSSDKRVKKLAKQELSKRNGNYTAVAKAYSEDAEIRKSIIEMAYPLPVRLRKIIATRLGEGGIDGAFAMSLLKLYDHEQDEEVKTQTSISYHTRLKTSEQDTKTALDALSQNIVSYGPDYEERRQAAFCGLVTLDRLDIMVKAKERIGSDRLCAISIIKGISPNIPLVKHILQNWDAITDALDEEFWPRISRMRSNPLDLWDMLCMFADEYPSPRNEAIQFLTDKREKTAKLNILRFLGRVRPKSQLLLEYCLKTLDSFPKEEALVAAELLGAHFGGDSNVLKHIMAGRAKEHIYEKVILSLCEGWPESEELEHIFKMVCEQKPRLNDTTYLQLICRKSRSEVIFDALKTALSDSRRYRRWYPQIITRPVTRRLRTDDNLLAMLIERLQNKPTPSEKATIPRLISAARSVSSEIRTWCIEETNRQLSSAESPEIGFDLIPQFRPKKAYFNFSSICFHLPSLLV